MSENVVVAAPAGEPGTPPGGQGRRRRLQQHTRHYLRSLGQLGVAMALLFFLWSLSPSLLPRSWVIQGAISGVAAAGGYGFGVGLSWAARHLHVPAPSAQWRRWLWWAIGLVALITIPVLLWLASSWQRDIRRLVHEPAGPRVQYLGVFVITALVAMALIGIVRLAHDIFALLTERVLRFLPRLIARVIAAVAVVALAVGIVTGVLYDSFIKIANKTYSAGDRGNKPGVSRPTAPERSGSPASLAPWSTLGKEGRAFVDSGPTPTQITGLTGRPAVEPIRVFVGMKSAPGLRAEAHLVLRELQRTGAFTREVLGLATPTGSGWVDSTLTDPLEYMFDGSSAVATMQYSYLPSYLSFVTDKDTAENAGRLLFDTIHDYWATLPADHRPRLVVYGESLGAYGGLSAFSSVSDLTTRTSGAVFAGTPNFTALWTDITTARRKGSPERLPVYGNGQTVRFAASAKGLYEPDGTLSHPKVVFLQHASDPIVWWSPSLIWTEPDWLRQPRGSDVVSQTHWYPFVTFWQVTCDMIVATAAPRGHGHRYGPETPTAWRAILHPPHWTDADTSALTALESQ